MKYIANHAALLGLALVATALAAVLFTGFLDVLARVDAGSFWSDAPGWAAPAPAVPGPATQTALAAVQGMLTMIVQGLAVFAVAVAMLVLLAAALGLVGLGLLGLREGAKGLMRPLFEPIVQREAAAKPVHGMSALTSATEPSFDT